VWTRGLQVGLTAVRGQRARHLPHVPTEEVFVGSLGRSTSRSDTTRGRLVIPRASDQDTRSEGLCHEVEDYQVIQGAMEQSF
jgi:hypothetical protein